MKRDAKNINWLEMIYDAIRDLARSTGVANQSDWNEVDESASSFIKNKPALKEVATSGSYDDLTDKPALKEVATSGSYDDLTDKPVVIIAGAVETDAFTPDEDEPTLAEAVDFIAAGKLVYLSYDDDGDEVLELVTAASAEAIETKNVTWQES